jgi:hypothetical protein
MVITVSDENVSDARLSTMRIGRNDGRPRRGGRSAGAWAFSPASSWCRSFRSLPDCGRRTRPAVGPQRRRLRRSLCRPRSFISSDAALPLPWRRRGGDRTGSKPGDASASPFRPSPARGGVAAAVGLGRERRPARASPLRLRPRSEEKRRFNPHGRSTEHPCL